LDASGTATSIAYTPLKTGTYYFRAHYVGDSNYKESTSGDTAEPLEVGPADSKTATELSKTSITLGESVTDKATVTGLGGSYPMPTGNVEFWVLPPGGVWTKFDTKALDASGTATSIAYTPLKTGTYYFRAHYVGDSNYKESTSGDTAEPLEVKPYTPEVETLLSASEITLGDSVTDKVTVTGLPAPFPDPTGDVEFYVSTDGGSTWTQFGATKTLVAGSATSDSYTPLAVGDYYFKAKYLGDSNYNGAESGAKEEPLKVKPYTPKVETLVSAAKINLGESVTDKVTVTGLPAPFPGPTGTVEFYVLAPGDVWTKYDTETLDASGTATSIPYKPSLPGTYYFKAKYLGDSNYDPAESGETAEPLDVLQVLVPTRTIGYWQTHTKFTEWVFDNKLNSLITIDSGTSHAKTIDTYEKLFGAFYASIPKNSYRTDRSPDIDQKRMILLQQLVGAILNHAANGQPLPKDPVTGDDIITAGNKAYSGTNGDEMTRIAGLLDDYNGIGEKLAFPADVASHEGSATPRDSQKLAKTGIPYWDSPL
jgi:hypothetical protein